ncbi:MAG: elongation factor G [Planctomycetes bacterium]|nr:elongation factor G [Planctomycetota bacterium]
MAVELAKLRNIGIIAHIDAGKTTLTERMLFFSGFTHRVGEVDKGTALADSDEEEQDRGITIYSACVTFPWKGTSINLIDTPGHVDFTAEVERSLRVLDGAVVAFSAREGVEAQSETVWRQADKYHVPRIAFINKVDRDGADFYRTLDEIEERLQRTPVPRKPVAINIPLGSGPPHTPDGFRGVVDLIEMKVLTFTDQSKGAEILTEEICEPLLEDAKMWRAQMLDQLSFYSDDLTVLLLAEEPVPTDLIRHVLREATLHDLIVPVLCGSALDGIGVQPVLDAVVDYLPSPRDMPPVEGTNPTKNDARAVRKPDRDEPFCGLLFKIQADRHGDLHYVRVYSGQLKANSRVYNPGKDKKENVPQLWRIQADRREQVQSVEAGDIIGIIGLRHSVTGDTLCDPRQPILLETISFPETVISMAIEPESSDERKKLSAALDMMRRQDPTFCARENEETGQTLISGMGELHLEVIKHRLLRDYKLDVRVHTPRVSYRETVETAVEETGECRRVLAGAAHFARLRIRMEPFSEGTKPVTVLTACGDSLPGPFLTAARETLAERADGGGMLGFPLTHAKITILGGETHETESNELAFRMAAADGFERCLRAAGIALLEPVMRLEVTTPEECMGEIVSDLQQRRAMITRTENRGRNTVIAAKAPLANLFGYAGAMRGLSQGRATCTMEPSSYGPAPPEVLERFL